MTSASVLKKLAIASAGTTLICLGLGEAAQAAAINFDSPGIVRNRGNYSLGFKFSTNKQIAVNELGFFDDQKNGLTETHDVGIFNESGQLLVSGIVKPSDALDGYFRYTSIPRTILDAGKTFYIAAVTGLENYALDSVGLKVDPTINYLADAYNLTSPAGTVTFPAYSVGTGVVGYFGPNFKSQPVPEPLTLGGTVVAGGIGWWMNRKKAVSQKAKF